MILQYGVYWHYKWTRYDPVPAELAGEFVYFAGQFGWSNRGELCLSSAPRLLGAVVQTWT